MNIIESNALTLGCRRTPGVRASRLSTGRRTGHGVRAETHYGGNDEGTTLRSIHVITS